jgi:streptomycin 6-kinase
MDLDVPTVLQDHAEGWLGLAGREWLRRLPDLVQRLTSLWDITLGHTFRSRGSFVASAARADGTPAVLKIPLPPGDFPYPQASSRLHEAAALRRWDGHGSIHLFERDAASNALLLEACRPGTPLIDSTSLAAADQVVAELLPRLWRPVSDGSGIPTLRDLAATMHHHVTRRYEEADAPFERSLFERAVAVLDELAGTSAEQVLLHGDAHHNNVLAAEREPWLLTDPLPYVGEREFDAVMFLLFRKGSMSDAHEEWDGAITDFCDQLGLDAYRVKAWTFVRLISDALGALIDGETLRDLNAHQGDLWSARLVHSLM